MFIVWIVINEWLEKPWDSREFGFLALFLGFEALIVTVLVLAKQNRDGQDDNIRTNRILGNTQSAEQEIRHLREKVDALTELVHAPQNDKARVSKP